MKSKQGRFISCIMQTGKKSGRYFGDHLCTSQQKEKKSNFQLLTSYDIKFSKNYICLIVKKKSL